MSLFYKPADGWAADVIPFYWQGEYHLFYLKDYRDPEKHGLGTPWEHLGTKDFVHFTEYLQALVRGGEDEPDLWVFTGSVIERDGLFHIYYTGHNRLYKQREPRLPQQAIMHATSSDLVHWTKDPANPILLADPERYEIDDWRDPFVFWNEDKGLYWMLIAARLRGGPSRRRGCIALASSPDLVKWTIEEPFWAPSLYYTHECPDLFRMGDWWYLVYSTFSERTVTHYRMSRSPSGPWVAPTNDTFDARAFYAAKTASDGTRRFAFGWNPTREGDSDAGRWHWGGNVVIHEVVQSPDGSLRVKVPPEVDGVFAQAQPHSLKPEIGQWREEGSTIFGEAGDGYAACRLGQMPERCRITARLSPSSEVRSCGVLLRAGSELEGCYEVRWEPGLSRVVVDRWPRPGDQAFMLERPLAVRPEEPVELKILVDDTVVEVYVNDAVALSTRAYDHQAGDWGLFVYEGRASFDGCQLTM